MEFPKKSCPAGRKRVTLGRFRNAILKEKLQMNMKNIIKNKQNELVQGMIALILCVALFCSAAASGKNDGSEWKMRHGGQKYEETGTDGRVQTPLYAGILAEFRTNEIEILVDNHEILTEAAERAAEESTHFCRDRSPGRRDGHGRASGRTSMSGAIILAISDAVCAVWQIFTAHSRNIPVRRGICTNMRDRCPATRRRGRSGRLAGRI